MRENYLVVARQFGLRPWELLKAVDRGLIDGWLCAGEVMVEEDQVPGLELERVEWVPLWVYAAEHRHKHITVVRKINEGELEGVLLGKGRRWVLISERSVAHL